MTKKMIAAIPLCLLILTAYGYILTNPHNLVLCGLIHNKNDEKTLIDLMKSSGIRKSEIRLEIHKSRYKLYVMKNNRVIRAYPVVFGGNPKDDKMREGDKCTPEGNFTIKGKSYDNRWSRFMLLDYPNATSLKKIQLAKKSRKIPMGARTGSGVGIHGVRKGEDFLIPIRYNWTRGCISLRTKDIIELFEAVPVGCHVIIYH